MAKEGGMETLTEKGGAIINEDSIQNVGGTKGGGKGSGSGGGKVNGEGPEVIHQNGEKENGLENGESGPERRRSSRVKPADKKEDPSPSQKVVGEVKMEEEKKEEKKEAKKEEANKEVEEEEEEVEEGEEEVVVEEKEYKVLRRSFGAVTTRTPMRVESRPSEVEVRNYLSGRISGRRSTRGNATAAVTPKRRAEEDDCDVGGKKAALDESWTRSPSWSFISTPFSKLGSFISSSTPSLRSRPPTTSDSMIVNYDEETVRQLDDSDVDIETVDETSPPFQQSPLPPSSSSRSFCSLM